MEKQHSSIESIQKFLDDFHLKTKVFDIVFRDDRDKNLNSLLKLEFSAIKRKEIIATLCIEDYSEDPKPDKLHNMADMWVFGKTLKKQEIYIKKLFKNKR
ncbi:MAG: toxin [Paludibacter sp.]